MTVVELKNLDKVFWPKEGFTKGDVVSYYERISSLILPYLRNRPMVLVRHPNGIKGASFFQKNVASIHLPSFVRTVKIRARSTGRDVHYVVCNNKATLLYLVNLGCIEMHVWSSRTRILHCPDYMVIDLDPGGNSFAEVAAVARETRKVIAAAGGTSLVKTSGKRGIHVYVPLRPVYHFDEVRSAARLVAELVHHRLPKLTSISPRLNKRRNRVYLDCARNGFGQTTAAPYSLRAAAKATVSTPLDWREVTAACSPARYHLRSTMRRIRMKGDIWDVVIRKPNSLRKLEASLRAMVTAARKSAARRN
ncbi:MAG: non-homologous end-joining DNA ligase [Xanthobacteraceae bacterium]